MAEKALTAVSQEGYEHGVSSRAVDDLMQAMSASGVSKNPVSRLSSELDEHVHAVLNRPGKGGQGHAPDPFDATYVKVRQNGRIVLVAATTAIGVNTDGRRAALACAEAEPNGTPPSPARGVTG